MKSVISQKKQTGNDVNVTFASLFVTFKTLTWLLVTLISHPNMVFFFSICLGILYSRFQYLLYVILNSKLYSNIMILVNYNWHNSLRIKLRPKSQPKYGDNDPIMSYYCIILHYTVISSFFIYYKPLL